MLKEIKNKKFQPIQPPVNDQIYNTDKPFYVNYSGWCKNAGDSYMRKILIDLISTEKQAILLPLYSLSNLDSPNKFKKPITPSVKGVKFIAATNAVPIATLTLSSSAGPLLKNMGIQGIGAQVDIDYTGSNGAKTQTFFIRNAVTDNELILIPSGRIYMKSTDKINAITIYETILSYFGQAIAKNVKVILLINKAQADGESSLAGQSFTGGDATLTAFLLQQMGGTVWRCANPLGTRGAELHSKSGYFYSQNTLITDTTNWSDAGMGTQHKSGANCSSVNNETCLVIKGNDVPEPHIFLTRVLANFANTARMYAYQQPCPFHDYGNFGGHIYGKSNTAAPGGNISKPRNEWSTVNCTCPTKPKYTHSADGVACFPDKKGKHQGTCDVAIDVNEKPQNSICYSSGTDPKQGCFGACTVDCCLRHGQTAPDPKTTSFEFIMDILSKLPNWPKYTCTDLNIKSPIPLGSVVKSSGKLYIMDPTFNWGMGIHIGNNELEKSITKKDIPKTSISYVLDNTPPYPPQGIMCSVKTKSVCS